MMWTIYELALNIYQGFLFTWFITVILTPPGKKANVFLYVICSMLTAAALSSYLILPMPEWDIWIFVFIVLYTLIFLKGRISQKIFWILVLIAVTRTVTALYYQVTFYILGLEMHALLQQTVYRILFTVSANLLLAIVLFILVKIFRKSAQQMNPSYLLLITVLMCVFLSEVFFKLGNENGIPHFWVLIGCLISLTIAVMSIVIQKIIMDFVRREQEYRYREELLKESGAQTEELKEMYTSMQRLRHDMNAYVRDIRKMIDTGELSDKPEFFEKLEKQLMPQYSTGNVALDSVLSVKVSKIRQSNIEFRGTNLHYAGGMNVTDAALCSLISNMLDNACEALNDRADRPGERFIYLQFAYNPAGLMIICENPLLGVPPKQRKRSFLSSKTEPYHGLGISIMKTITEDAGGQFDIVLSDDLFRILAVIPLKEPDQEEKDSGGIEGGK